MFNFFYMEAVPRDLGSLKLVLVPNEITIDEKFFVMLVRNIILNAYKYTKSQGKWSGRFK